MKLSIGQLFHSLLVLFCLIYSNTITGQTINNVRISGNSGHLCKNGNYTILFDTTGTPGSSFVAQLSSFAGDFSSPIVSNSGTTLSISITVPATATISNNYSIRVISTSPSSIVSDTLIGVTITQPTPNFTFTPDSACAGTSINLQNTSTPFGTFNCLWTFSGPSGTPNSNNSCSPNVVFNPSIGSTYVNFGISLLASDIYGCSDSISKNITVIPRPSARTYASLLVSGNFANVPSGNLDPDTIRKCNNTIPFQLSLANSSTTNSVNSNYSFIWGDATSNTNVSTFSSIISHTYLLQGEYNFQLIVTGLGGCTTTRNKYIYIGTNPSIGLGNPGNTTGECIAKTYTFPITNFTGNSPGTRYLITSNDKGAETSYVHPPPITYTKNYNSNSCGFVSLGSYDNSFHLRITAVNSCASSAATVEPIQLSSKPQPNFSYNNPACINTNVTFSNSSLSGKFVDPSPPNSCDTTSFPEWLITPATGWTLISGTMSPIISASDNITIRFTIPGIYQIKLIIKSPAYLLNPAFTCGADSITKTICVQPIPIPNFGFSLNPSNACKNNIVTINNTSNTLLSCATPIYTWSVRDSSTSTILAPGNRYTYLSGTDSNSVNPIFQFSQKGKYAIRLTISNTCQGNFFKDTLVIIKDIPVVTLPPDIIYCDSQTVVFGPIDVNHNPTYDSSFSNISTYNWSITQTPGPQTGFTFLNGSSTSRNPIIRFTNFTTLPISYRVILTATNECGISLPDTQNIIINPQPIVSTISVNDSFCSGGTTAISLSNNLIGAVTYYWRAIPNSPNIIGYSSDSIGSTGPISQTIFNIGSTTETLIYRITAKQLSTNCFGDSVDVIITVYPIPHVLSANKSICSGDSTNLTIFSTVDSSLYTWTATSIKGISTGFSNQTTPTFGLINQKIINSSLNAIDSIKYVIHASANGCNSPDTTIYVLVYPLPTITGDSQTICSGTLASYTPLSPIPGTTYTYTTTILSGTVTGYSNGTNSINQTLVNTGTIPAVVRYTITPTGPSPSNCVGLPVIFTVTVNPIPVLSILGSSTICSGTQTNIQLNSNVSGTLFRYDTARTAGILTYGYYPKSTDTLSPIAQTIYNIGTINSVVRYTITPWFGSCNGSPLTHDVTIIPSPTPGNLDKDTTVCGGNNSGSIILSSFSGTILRWERSIAPFLTFDSIIYTSSSYTFSNLTQTTKYRVVLNTGAAGACGEVKTPYVQISVDSPTVAGILTGTDTVCINTNSGALNLIGSRGSILEWQKANTLPGTWSTIISSSNVNPFNYLNLTQSTWYRVMVQNGVCPAMLSDSVRIKVDSLPSAAITRDTSYCLNSVSTPIIGIISANSISSGIGTWRFLSGPNSPTISNISQATTTISNLINGIYFFEWSVGNGKCAPNLDTLKLTIYQPLVANIGSNQTICYGQSPSILTGPTPTGGSGTYTYQWQQSANGSIYSDITGATLLTYQPPILTSNTYYRRITTSGTCILFSNSILISVLPAISSNSIYPNSAVCIGTISPIINGSNPIGGNGIYHYQWQKYIGGIWVNLGVADTLINYSPGLLGSTSIFRRIVSSGQCIGTFSLASNPDTITIYPLPIVNAGGDYSKCSNQPKYLLSATPSGGVWSGSYVIGDSLNPSAMPLGSYSLVYTYTNSNLCVNSDTVIVTIISPPIVSAGSDFSICENSPSFQLSGFNPSTGGTWSGNGVSSSGLFNPSITGAGSFQLIYSFTAGSGCSGSDTLVVTVNPKPNPNFNIATQKCALDTFAVNSSTNSIATISGYFWTVSNDGGFSNSILDNYSNPNVIGTFPENKTIIDINYTLKLVAVTNFGCRDSVSKQIALRRRPNAQFYTGSQVNCGPASYSISNLTSNVLSSYLWSTNPSATVSIVSPSSTNPTIIFPVNNSNLPINYGIKLIANRNDATLSCADTIDNSILIYPKPIAAFSISPLDSSCSPLTVNFSNISDPKNSEPINSMSFVWSFSNFPSDTSINQTKTYTNYGVIDSVRTVQLIASSKWGCKDTANSTITIFPFPKSDFNASFYSSCAPFIIDNSIISLQQYPNAVNSYTWEILDKQFNILSTSSGTNIPSATLSNADDTLYYRLITTNIHGCKPDTLIRLFRTISNPKASFLVNDSIGCSPLNVIYTNTSTPGVILNWSYGNGLSSSNNTGNINYINYSHTVDSLFTLKLIITAGLTGCKDSVQKQIRVYPKPLSNFSIPNSNCANSILAPTNSSLFKAGTTTYGWKLLVPSSNSLLTFSDTISSTPSITFPDNQLSIDTIYTIRLRVTSVDGCIHDTTKNISILRRPLVQFTVPPTFCGPSTVAISNNTSNVGSNWLWSVEPNASASFSNISTQNPNLSFNQNNGNDSINYSIKLIATRIGTGCLDSLTRLVTIYPKPQAQFTTITQDSCGPRWVRFTNTSNPKNAEPLSSMSFVWSSLSNNHTSINDSGFFVNSTINDSTYSVSLIATSKHGCKDTFENSVVVKPNAKAVFTASSIVNCAPFYITPKITPIAFPNANSNYYWYANDSLIGSNLSFPNFYLNNANDSVLIKLKAISKNGCKDDSMEIWFRTIPNPVPAFTTSADTGCSALTVNFTNTSSPGVSSAWTFSNGASTGAGNPFPITFVNPSNTANASYTAKLVITAGSGCKDSISKSILVYPKPLANFSIPNSNCANSILAPTNSSLFKAGTTTYGWKLLVPSSNSLLTFSDTISSTPSITFPDNQLSIDTIYTIRLRVTSVDGCIHDTTRNISILRRPLAQFTVPPTFCGPSTVAINNNTTNVGSNWLWSVEPNSSASFSNISTQNPNLSFNQNNGNDSINYSIKLIATRTGTGCLDSLTRLVTIYPKPLAQFTTITQDSCGPRWVRFTNISNPKNAEPLNSMSFVWSSLSNNHTSINDSGFFVNSTINDSTYSVSLIATSKHGCKDTFENSVVVKPNAKAVFTRLIGTSCAPFNITSSNISAQAFINANNTYEWYRNGIYLGSGLTFPGTSIPNQADSGLIKLKAISKNGCKNDSMEMWFYTIENPKPNFVSIDSITCSGTNIQFINLSIPTTGLTYRWELGGTNNIVSSKNTNFTFYNYGISDTTINIKLVTLAGGTGCLDSISKQLIIKPLPNPDFGLSDTFLCYPKLLLANNISTQIPPINNTSFRWFINPLGVGISNDTSNSQVAISFPDNQSGVSKYYQITLTAESNFGCIDSVQKNVRIPSRPITNFKFNIDSSCGPISITTNNQSQYSGVYQWSSLKLGPTITNPSNLNTSLFFPAHFGLVDSIYPIKLITTNIDGCRDTLIKPFLVFPNPISMFSSSLDSGCAPLPIDFFSESIVKKPANYIWNFGDGTSLNTNIDSATHSYSGSIYRDTLFISSLISTSVNGCRDTVSKPINVLSGAVANITLEDTLICSNASNPSKLKIINSSFGSVDTFYWDFGDGTTLITTEDSIIFKPFPFEGTYTITLKAVNTCRTSYDTANVTVQVPPTVEISKTDSVGCSPLDVTFTSQSNNVYRASYFWTFGNGNTSISAIPPIQTYLQSLTTDTFYYIRLNVSNVCGNFPKFDTVRILPKPTAIFLSNTLIGCSPLEIYLSNFSVGIPQEIKWYFGNGDSSNRFNLDYPYKPIIYRTIDTPTVYKIRLIVSNICGIDSMSKYITVLPNTVKSFFSTDVQDGCESLVVKFKDLSYGGANIHWNFGDGGTSADSSPVHTFSSPGSYKVRQYVNNNCSYDTSSVMIYVYPKPKFTITKTIGNICINQSVQFNSNLTDSGSIIWHFGDGDSSTFYNPTHKYLSPGKKVFTATLTSNFNTCKNTIKDSLTIYDLPIISIASDSIRGCLNQTFNFEAISNYNHFYSWDFGDSNIAVGQKSNYVFKNPGTYTIKLVATSIQGCIDSTTKQIEVYPIPTALFDYSPRDTCNGPAWVSFNNLSIGGNAYWWDFGNGNTSTNTNSVQFYDGIAKYKIQLVTSNAYNCYDTTEHFFEIFSKPVPDFSIETKNYCIGDSIKFTNKSKLSKTYFWDFGDGNYSTLENPTHKYDTVGTYSIKLIAFAGLVCADSITKTSAITIHPPPDASFIIESADPNKPFRTFRFSANSKNQLRYFWDFEKGETGTGQTIIFTYDEIDTLKCRLIYLTVSSDYGCMDTSEQKICLEPYWNGLYVPNAFTPDYGLGDVRIFNPIGIELKSYHLKIFNKWGEIIWESTALIDGKPAVGWDGINMKDGSNCLPGSYIWTIEATFTNGDNWPGMLYPGSKKPAKKGNVTLIR